MPPMSVHGELEALNSRYCSINILASTWDIFLVFASISHASSLLSAFGVNEILPKCKIPATIRNKESISFSDSMEISLNSKESVKLQKNDLIPLNIKKYAHIELLKENISNKNIDISNLCTYESNHNFHSWRRTKTYLRQWNFISS